MTRKRLYALTDREAETLKALARESATTVSNYALAALTPLDTDDAVERMARGLAYLEPGEPWPTNAELGGGPTSDRDVEYRQGLLQEVRAALDALLVGEQE